MASSIGVVVASKKITLVEGEMNSDGSFAVIKDETFNLETGPRPAALRKMRQRLCDRLGEGAKKLVVKASSGGRFASSTGMLQAAELRGVLLTSAPDGVDVIEVHSKSVSRAKSQKIQDYLADDSYFEDNFAGAALRKGSREAAFLLFEEEAK